MSASHGTATFLRRGTFFDRPSRRSGTSFSDAMKQHYIEPIRAVIRENHIILQGRP